jgi:uroporphyrinogen decarboxylase
MTDTSPNFEGLRVAAFQSRRGDEMSRLIERFGGVPRVSPSMREVPVDDPREAVEFAHRLMAGEVDMVLFTTGTGIRHWMEQIDRRVDRSRLLAALSDVVTVARGPKPVVALGELGIKPTHAVPEPNTWREVLGLIDAKCPVAGMVVGLQEYGEPNPSLVAGLEARGARVVSLKVYRWELPESTGPLEDNILAIAHDDVDVLLFTSAQQVVHMLDVAERLGLGDSLREGIARAVMASIGPTTSEQLRRCRLPVDVEPLHPKMGHLVQHAAAQSREILARKRRLAETLALRSVAATGGARPAWEDGPFMKACRHEPCRPTPVWLMRQAGRYMEEYRRIRAEVSFMELCRDPQRASEVMVLAVERLGVDAAIVFSDLLPILEPMGLVLEFGTGEGPRIDNPVREAVDVERVLELESLESLEFVTEAVRQTRRDLSERIPLIGFAGAPFTLASYAIEGGASRNYLHTKTLMYRDEGAWRELMLRLARAVARYLAAQIASGAQAVQIFDSWVGCLSPRDYRRFVLPYMRQIIETIEAPVIHFATGNPALLGAMAEAGGDLIGVDWRIGLDEAWRAIGHDRGIQGNLDPAVLLATPQSIRAEARTIVELAAGRPGHVFNLGHGVLPQTPVDNARLLVDTVHELTCG